MDSFFVSCERLVNPALRGKPVIVGGRKGERGVVCSASYEARPFGVRSGMPLRTAEKLCPQAIFVSGQYKLYSKYSRKVYVLLRRIAPVVEYASIDEFYLDFTGCEALYGNDPAAMAQRTRESVLARTGLSCSVAIAPNKYTSKIAGKTVKPSSGKPGWIVVPEGGEQAFLAPLPIERLHGAGEKTQPKLKALGLEKIGDILTIPLKKLEEAFGPSAGHWFYEAARGIDDSPVAPFHPSKSVGHETTFDQDTNDPVKIRQTLAWLSEKSCYRLRRLGKKAGTVTLKLRYDDFQTLTRARSIPLTHDDAQVLKAAEELFQEAYSRNRKVRLLGVSLSKFEKGEGESWLFPDMADTRKEALFKTMDVIKRKYGFSKLGKASSLEGTEGRRGEGGASSFEKPKTR
jgi:DNA polymerase-4